MSGDDATDANRFILWVQYPERGRDVYFPREVFWIYRDPSKPLDTLSALDALILLQKILRSRGFSRVIVRRVDPETEAKMRAASRRSPHPLESFISKDAKEVTERQ